MIYRGVAEAADGHLRPLAEPGERQVIVQVEVVVVGQVCAIVLAEERKQTGTGNKLVRRGLEIDGRVRPVGMGCVGHVLVGII